MDGIGSRLLDDDAACGFLKLQILLACEGVSGVAAHCESACTLHLHVSLAVEGALVESSCRIGKRVLGAWSQDECHALAALDVDGRPLGGCEVEAVEGELALQRACVSEGAVAALAL